MSEGRVLRIRQLLRPVESLARASSFHVEALGFEPAQERGAGLIDAALVEAAYGSASRGAQTFTLGQQRLTLVEVDKAELAQPFDQGSGDTRLQHMALVCLDADNAWQRVQERSPDVVSISRGGPRQLPAASGGVTALKFRDPDGHPLELLQYAKAGMPRHWHDVALRAGSQAVLGVDHTAIGVADAQASIRFYTEVLGFSLDAQQVNRGVEQEELDGLATAEVDVVALGPALGTPHLELLGYRSATPARHSEAEGLRAFTVMQVDGLDHIVRRWRAGWQGLVAPRETGHRDIMLAHDPDGHALVLWQDRGH